jgi:STE24 endopeptidase
MLRLFISFLLALFVNLSLAQEVASPAQVMASPVAAVQSAAVAPAPFDAVAATQAYMQRLQGEARQKSDGYAEGGYWLLLWNLLVGLAVAWFLLSQGISARMRDFAQRCSPRQNLQTLIYVLLYVPLVTLLSFPLSVYQEFYREHQYGLSNMTFGAWLGEAGIGLGVGLVVSALAFTGLYAVLRRVPTTWWAWGTLGGAGLMVVMMMVSPVFIAPLFNTYKPVPEGPVREQILSLARANGIPTDNVYYFDASRQTKRISANVSGLWGTTRISLNDNLLNRTSVPEIRAVMAHEMGHYVLNHSITLTMWFSLLLLGGMLFLRSSWDSMVARFGSRFGVQGIADPAGLPLMVALFSVYFFLATPIANTIIRSAETEADLFGLNASREPDGFSEAIFKLSEYRKLEPGAAEEFVFFDHPSGHTRILSAMRWKAENR